jgi:hypothetical protein
MTTRFSRLWAWLTAPVDAPPDPYANPRVFLVWRWAA